VKNKSKKNTPAAPNEGRVRLSSYLDDEKPGRSKLFDRKLVARVMPYFQPFRRYSLGIMFSIIVGSATAAAGPWLIGITVDDLSRAGNIHNLDLMVLAFIGVGMFGWGAGYVENVATTYLSQGILLNLRLELFRHLQRLPLAFYDGNEVGRIMARIQNDVEQLEEFFDSGLFGVVGDILTLGGVIIALFLMERRLALVTLSVVPLLAVIITLWHIRATAATLRSRQAMAMVNGTLQENIAGIRVIQSLVRENRNVRSFREVNGRYLTASLRSSWLWAAVQPIVELLIAVATALIIGYGGRLVLAEEIEIGTLVAFALYVQRFFEPIRDLTMQYGLFQRATTSLSRIFEILDVPPEPEDSPEARIVPDFKGDIVFDHVSFSYLDDIEVLHDISLHISPGEMVALVGPTGAGKTTLAGLVGRFYETSEGAIYIDGNNIRNITRQSLTAGISVVPQEAFLFTGTIADNIRYGKIGASDAEVVTAAEAVGANEFINKLVKGYQAPVQERGMNLSAGQRQLICLARALIANPRVLILDEATANIDTVTEAVLQRALQRLFRGRTALVIAHRLATVKNAGRIIVLDKGRIKESGTHSELLNRGGLYAELYTMAYDGILRNAS
jgi:ABC-type multidrug transport system fused ATPase/permease subunit